MSSIKRGSYLEYNDFESSSNIDFDPYRRTREQDLDVMSLD
jgi:hypothetical protein